MSGENPTPWTYEVHELSEGFSAIVYDANGRRVATDHLSEDGAARLVNMANSHAELVEALACEKALGEGNFGVLSKHGYDGPRIFVRAAAFCDKKTEAALAKAGASHA